MSTSPDGTSGTPAPTLPPAVPRRNRRLLIATAAIAAIAGVALVGYRYLGRAPAKLAAPGDAVYEEYVEAVALGVAALDVDVWAVGQNTSGRAIELIPQDPAAWATRALVHLRTARLPEAEG